MAHKITDAALKRIQREEGWSGTVYTCAGGEATIGYGITNADAALIGVKVKPGLTIDKATGEKWLRLVLAEKYGPAVDKYDDKYHWTDAEFAALVSFEFNLGKIDDLTKNGTRTRPQIADAMLLYVGAKGKPNDGLKARRQREHDLFVSGWRKDMDTLRRGDRGQQVKVLQIQLNTVTGSTLDADGVFGAQTEETVRKCQRLHGLAQDGACGPKTWEKLL